MKNRITHYINKKCKLCGKPFVVPKGQRKRFCSRACAYKGRRKKDNCKCRWCGKKFYRSSSTKLRGEGKFCSRKCYNKKISFLSLRCRIPKTCHNCKKEFTILRSRTDNKKRKFCSRECRVKSNNHKCTCKNCGKIFSKTSYRISIGKGYCSIGCSHQYNWKHNRKKMMHSFIKRLRNMPKSKTSIENKIEQELKNLNIKFIPQKCIIGKTHKYITRIDFFIEPNICIYVDGDYWHSEHFPGAIKRDNRNNKELPKDGYRVVRILGSTIQNKPYKYKRLLSKIKRNKVNFRLIKI